MFDSCRFVSRCLPLSLFFSRFCCHFCCTHWCLSDKSSVYVDRPCVEIHRPRSAHYTTYAAFKCVTIPISLQIAGHIKIQLKASHTLEIKGLKEELFDNLDT